MVPFEPILAYFYQIKAYIQYISMSEIIPPHQNSCVQYPPDPLPTRVLHHKPRDSHITSSRPSKATRISKIPTLNLNFTRQSISTNVQTDYNKTYFDNDVERTRCYNCGQLTSSITEHRAGCLAFSCCLLLCPFGLGGCFIPFLIKSCLDVEERCQNCSNAKRIRRATIL